ncbi:hypothetical protein BLAT2472_50470 [Burkholderia latens]
MRGSLVGLTEDHAANVSGSRDAIVAGPAPPVDYVRGKQIAPPNEKRAPEGARVACRRVLRIRSPAPD